MEEGHLVTHCPSGLPCWLTLGGCSGQVPGQLTTSPDGSIVGGTSRFLSPESNTGVLTPVQC